MKRGRAFRILKNEFENAARASRALFNSVGVKSEKFKCAVRERKRIEKVFRAYKLGDYVSALQEIKRLRDAAETKEERDILQTTYRDLQTIMRKRKKKGPPE